MSRRRLTWENTSRKASAPPATPGYEEPSIHPAAYPDPEADAYENGDTSSWAEDPHAGPYPNGAPPALPGTDAPQGHPATDMAHYFPNGVGKQASRQLRAALEAKAAKCIRIAARMLGKTASHEAIEEQALDLMALTERQIQATLRRFADEGGDGNTDLLAFENMTLTPPRTGGDDDTEELLQAMLAEESGDVEGDVEGEDEEAMLASMMAEEQKRLASLKPSKKAGQNDPRATYKGKKADEDEDEAAEEDKPEGDEASKKAAHFQRLAAYWTKLAKKADDEEPEEPEENEGEAEEDEAKESSKKAKKSEEVPDALKENQFKAKDEKPAKDDKAAKKAAFMRLAGEFLSADLKETLAALIAEDDASEAPAAEKAADDFMMDEMGEDPMLDGLGFSDAGDIDMDDLSVLYGMHTASEESDEGEQAEEEEKPAKEEKQAAVRPQPRRASTGVKTLGTVAKVASSSGVDDLSRLWTSAPDVSDIFGTSKS